MEESAFIVKSEKFLEKLKKKEIKIKDFETPTGFIKTYTYLKCNLLELQKLKNFMESRGFKSPYRSVALYSPPLKGEMKSEDVYDIKRHARYFRMKASIKKNLLDRVNSAISSHKIALGNLEEYGFIKCRSCNTKFRFNELKIQNLKKQRCDCGSTNIQVNFNPQGIHRLDIIPYLPLSGDYMVKISDLDSWARDAFKKVVGFLKNGKKGVITSASMIIRVFESGRWIRKRVTIDKIDTDYEKKIKKEYGPNARIEFIQFHRKRSTIIGNRHIRTALALAYAGFSQDLISKNEEKIFKKRLKNFFKIKRYDEIVRKAKAYTPTFIKGDEELKEAQEKKLKDLLVKEGLADKDGKLVDDLRSDLAIREKMIKNLFSKIPLTLILWDLARYYLTTSYDRRTKYAAPFPNLKPVLDHRQVKTFNGIDKGVIKILRECGENIVYIKNLGKVLLKKFEIEEKIKGMHMKINPIAFGAALINLEANIDPHVCAGLFHVSVDELKREKGNIKTFSEPSTKKAKMFLEMIKK